MLSRNIKIPLINFLKQHKFYFTMIVIASLCWGRLLTLKGIWWDDWAWTWHYFNASSLYEFLMPFKSLRHLLDGYFLFFNFRLLDIIPIFATNIWNIEKFIIFMVNALLLYYILKNVLDNKSILPETIAIVYLVSPIVHNLCLVELTRRFYLFFFLLSILFSIKSINGERFKISYYLLALIFSVISMFGIESFIFFDLARPLLILYIFSKKGEESLFKAIKKAILYWIPFILIGIFILFYNTGLLKPRYGVYKNVYNLYSLSICGYIYRVFVLYIKSLCCLFIAFRPLNFLKTLPFIFNKMNIFLITLFSFVASLFALLALFRNNRISRGDNKESCFLSEAKLVMFFAIFLIIIGLFPYVMVRDGAGFGTESRHALLASLGVSVFIPSILLLFYYKGFIKKEWYYFLFGGFIFLSTFQCNMAVKAFNDDWQQQCNFWWQFMWRVPDIKDKTYLLVDMPRERFDYFGPWRASYEFSCPLNLLYAKLRNKNEINNHFADEFQLAFATQIEGSYLKSYLNNSDKNVVQFESYRGPQAYYPKNLIVASFHKGILYLNQEINKSNSSGRVNIEPIIATSSPDQIIYEDRDIVYPFRWIIGSEPKRDWRYYFQKAKALEYRNDYAGIINLYNEAEKMNVIPQLPEALPLFFIKSFYIVGDIGKAKFLLSKWAFSSEGSLKKALDLFESIKVINNNPNLHVEIEKQIKHIWRVSSFNDARKTEVTCP